MKKLPHSSFFELDSFIIHLHVFAYIANPVAFSNFSFSFIYILIFFPAIPSQKEIKLKNKHDNFQRESVIMVLA